ncbi:hypothetical protein K458DRAFT_390273 [Lentithecium fluviatile CBS 122367]|uniref:Uncharacterized protein n=1 Tax=Lentithecium fluviatile CBS 122367 TaxID=1168545 RepID=A0A6G1IYF1_9PLEO|nr:hypothetical protein K458DRAFT_390273 [Lentithecium fluviatile CBS 122367]
MASSADFTMWTLCRPYDVTFSSVLTMYALNVIILAKSIEHHNTVDYLTKKTCNYNGTTSSTTKAPTHAATSFRIRRPKIHSLPLLPNLHHPHLYTTLPYPDQKLDLPPSLLYSNEPTIYKLHKASRKLPGPTHAIGLSAIDPSLSNIADYGREERERLQQAYLKLNMCNFAVESMIAPISDKLKGMGARVERLLVCPRAHIILKPYEDSDPSIQSVFGITAASGAQFIADFTIEQFGHDAEDRFSTQAEYLDRFTRDGEWILAPLHHQADAEQTEVDLEEQLRVEICCWDLDWKVLESMEMERLGFVRAIGWRLLRMIGKLFGGIPFFRKIRRHGITV